MTRSPSNIGTVEVPPLLFSSDELPRASDTKRMRVADAGHMGGGKGIRFECPHCEYDTGWIVDEWTTTENKRGFPCPICNSDGQITCSTSNQSSVK